MSKETKQGYDFSLQAQIKTVREYAIELEDRISKLETQHQWDTETIKRLFDHLAADMPNNAKVIKVL